MRCARTAGVTSRSAVPQSRWRANALDWRRRSVASRARITIALVAVVAVALALPSGALASTKIGQLFQPSAAVGATMFQTGVETGAGYTVPSDGVITSWSFLPDSGGATLKLKAA